MAARSLALIAVLAATLVGWGCATGDGKRQNPLRRELGVEREREIGFEFDQELQLAVPLIDDPVVLDVVNELGQSIVERVEPQPFIYRFRVIVDPNLNAFAVPGGFVYLHSGTVLSAGSVEELAGVLGHEIGHVKGRHIARMQEQAAIPNLLTSLAGIAAAVATGEPGFAIAAQGINVALQLKYTRELEDEADRIGSTFMARAGYDPQGMVRFFERIQLTSQRPEIEIPPYLYSHPQVDERMASVERYAHDLTVSDRPPAVTESDLHEAQLRLARLIQEKRSSWPVASTPTARDRTAPLLERATELTSREEPGEALVLLTEAEVLDPDDPRIPFRRGELLEQLGRYDDAIAAYRRAVRLDPTPALTYYQLARVYKAKGDAVHAIYYLDHATRRFSGRGDLQRKASLELRKLSFPVIAESGLADGSSAKGADTVAGFSREAFSSTDARVAWWGALSDQWVEYRERITVRWTDPNGQLVAEGPAERRGRDRVAAVLKLEPGLQQRHGLWRVEALFEGDVVDRHTFRLAP